MINLRQSGFTVFAVCICLVFCSAMVVAYYRYTYRQAFTYHRLSQSWISDSKHNLQKVRNLDQQFTKG